MQTTRVQLIAALLLIGCLPIPTPLGSLYLIEPFLYVLAMHAAASRRRRLEVPTICLFALAIPVGALVHAGAGLRGEWPDVIDGTRAVLLVTSGILYIANNHLTSFDWRKIVGYMGPGMAILVIVERVVGITWNQNSSAALIAARASGPLGPGPTASLILAAVYLATSLHRWPSFAISVAGLFLLASRAHLIAVAVLIFWEFRPSRFNARIAIRLGALTLIALVLFPYARTRLIHAATISESRRSRTEVWSAALDQTSPLKSVIGIGPGAFRYEVPQVRAVIVYAHSQYITLWLEEGVIGMVVTGAVIYFALRYGRKNDALGLAVAVLVACVFGEFLLSTAVPAAIGAVFVWAVLLVPGISEPAGPLPVNVRKIARHLLSSDPQVARLTSAKQPHSASVVALMPDSPPYRGASWCPDHETI